MPKFSYRSAAFMRRIVYISITLITIITFISLWPSLIITRLENQSPDTKSTEEAVKAVSGESYIRFGVGDSDTEPADTDMDEIEVDKSAPPAVHRHEDVAAVEEKYGHDMVDKDDADTYDKYANVSNRVAVVSVADDATATEHPAEPAESESPLPTQTETVDLPITATATDVGPETTDAAGTITDSASTVNHQTASVSVATQTASATISATATAIENAAASAASVSPDTSNKHADSVSLLLPRVIPIVFVTQVNSGFCDMILSAAAYKNVVNVIGWHGSWNGFGTKIAAMLEFLKTVNDDDVVLLHDGYDVHHQSSLDDMAAKFVKMNASIVYGAEKNCWTMDEEQCKLFPPSPLPRSAYGPKTNLVDWGVPLTPPRFVDAGAVMGYAKPLRLLFEDMMTEVRNIESDGRQVDDQAISSMRFLSSKWDIQLDYYMNLFMDTDHSENDIELVDDPITNTTTVSHDTDNIVSLTQRSGGSIARNMYRNVVTNTVPSILQFTGNHHRILAQTSRNLMWWSQPDAVDLESIEFMVHRYDERVDNNVVDRLSYVNQCTNNAQT